jgi:hypothetical protein
VQQYFPCQGPFTPVQTSSNDIAHRTPLMAAGRSHQQPFNGAKFQLMCTARTKQMFANAAFSQQVRALAQPRTPSTSSLTTVCIPISNHDNVSSPESVQTLIKAPGFLENPSAFLLPATCVPTQQYQHCGTVVNMKCWSGQPLGCLILPTLSSNLTSRPNASCLLPLAYLPLFLSHHQQITNYPLPKKLVQITPFCT